MTKLELQQNEQDLGLQRAEVAGVSFFGSTSELIPVKVYDEAGKEIRLPLPGLAESVGMVLKIPINIPGLGLGSNESAFRVLSGEASLGDSQELTSPIRLMVVGLEPVENGYNFIDPTLAVGREAEGVKVGLLMADVPAANFLPKILENLPSAGDYVEDLSILDQTWEAVCGQLARIHNQGGNGTARELVEQLGNPKTIATWIETNFFKELEELPEGSMKESFADIKKYFSPLVKSELFSSIINQRLNDGWIRRIHGDAQIDNIAVFPVENGVQVEILDGITFEDEQGNQRNWDVRDVAFDYAYFAYSAAAKLFGNNQRDLAFMAIKNARERFLYRLEGTQKYNAEMMFELMGVYAGVVLTDTFLRRSRNYRESGDQIMAEVFAKQAGFLLQSAGHNLQHLERISEMR